MSTLQEFDQALGTITENEEGLSALLLLTEHYHLPLSLEGAFSIGEVKQLIRASYIAWASSDPRTLEPGMRPFLTRHVIEGKRYDFNSDGSLL